MNRGWGCTMVPLGGLESAALGLPFLLELASLVLSEESKD